MSYHLTLGGMAIIKKSTNKNAAGGNVNWCSHYGKQYGGSSNNLKIVLPCDPAILLQGICSDKNIIKKDTCTPMFIAALFIVAKTWKQPKCPLTWIKMWYIYMYTHTHTHTHTHNELLLSHKKE